MGGPQADEPGPREKARDAARRRSGTRSKGCATASSSFKSGVIGPVKEVHSWIDGDRGMPQIPSDGQPVPPHLDWDLWLGPAAERPYTRRLRPYDWRFWWDFGTGETGNWGCHILDIPFWALDLGASDAGRSAAARAAIRKTTPKRMTTRFDFPANDKRPAGHLPLVPRHAADRERARARQEQGHQQPVHRQRGHAAVRLRAATSCCRKKNSPTTKARRRRCRRRPASTTNGSTPAAAAHAGELQLRLLRADGRDACCLANVAYRVQGEFDWNAAEMKAGRADVENLLRREYRKGWET